MPVAAAAGAGRRDAPPTGDDPTTARTSLGRAHRPSHGRRRRTRPVPGRLQRRPDAGAEGEQPAVADRDHRTAGQRRCAARCSGGVRHRPLDCRDRRGNGRAVVAVSALRFGCANRYVAAAERRNGHWSSLRQLACKRPPAVGWDVQRGVNRKGLPRRLVTSRAQRRRQASELAGTSPSHDPTEPVAQEAGLRSPHSSGGTHESFEPLAELLLLAAVPAAQAAHFRDKIAGKRLGSGATRRTTIPMPTSSGRFVWRIQVGKKVRRVHYGMRVLLRARLSGSSTSRFSSANIRSSAPVSHLTVLRGKHARSGTSSR